jgi:predicted nucleic acid-binding protein
MLIDTSGLLCLYHKDEPQHETAVKLYENSPHRLTHSYILTEFVPLAHSRGFPREKNLEFARRLIETDEVSVIWVDEVLHRHALDLLFQRTDKTYSLCDAVSFVVMREAGLSDALTTDKHFIQEGFVRLLEP